MTRLAREERVMAMTMEDFLGLLNGRLVVEGESIRRKTREEIEGQQQLFERSLVAAEDKPIDLVIEGPCASSSFRPEATKEFPLGRYDGKSWLHQVIEEHKPKSVAIFANCCRMYNPDVEEMVRAAFPEITFYFVECHDFCEQPWYNEDVLAQDFVHAGLVKIGRAQ